MSAPLAASNSTPLERDARVVNARGHHHDVHPGEIAIGVIIGRTSEFFDFFVYAIASVLVFPSLIFPQVDALTGTLYSFALFPLAFLARPLGSLIFITIDRRYGRGVKLTISLFLLGLSTIAMAFVPGYQQIGVAAAWFLAALRIGQGIALGGVWDGLPSLLALNAPQKHRGWYAMIPQLGAPLGLLVASGLFAFFSSALPAQDFLAWGWRYPFFVAFAINVVALFARLRLVVTPEFEHLFETRELQPASIRETLREDGRIVLLGAFAPLASFALFHLVTVFPLSWAVLFNRESASRFLVIEMAGAVVGVLAMLASGLLADRFGRRNVLGVSAGLIGVFSGLAPTLLDAGASGELTYMLGGFLLLGLAFGQSSGAINASFSGAHRYTGAALTSDLSWLLGAGFAPLAALLLASNFGLWAIGAYLLSGAVCTLVALGINKELARQTS
ncbi:MFS transporter [uncultured Sphingomonas sp.]|uniref:MFS transporter n=1 Tax=uncultured Sphingomonas sp. TaxID=158754 RepID=UPI0025D28234|nr:MFS transporter [uncultured Sphingomonas sp.]